MKFKILIILLACLFLTQTNASDTKEESFPIRFCLWPGVWSVPADTNIKGFSFGLATGIIKNKKVTGCDLGLLLSQTKNFSGFQMGLGTVSEYSKGVMVGFGTTADYYEGCQIGIANKIEDSKSIWQIGLFNSSRNTQGVQIGLLNDMDNGFLPVCPFINFSKSK
ncbi:MAG TPA: hypothetical protein QF753_04720 [Victivallales bacterium]|nr:hypothetical protein [Victivallales bacterium]